MVLLESFDRFDDLIEFEPTTGQMVWLSKRENPALAFRPIQGVVSRLDGHLVILFRENHGLYLRVDDLRVELTNDARVELEIGSKNALFIVRNEVPLVRLEYEAYMADKTDQWRMYLDPFIQDDHFDFGLFLFNTLNDLQKRDAVYSVAPQAS
ncbi:MAG TPA: hypothetical protein PK170_04585 [Anaerolineae bacterium]|nr:hypothetical protein [Anaerolineae bacterium]